MEWDSFVAWVCIIILGVSALAIASPIYRPGMILNGDNGVNYLLAKCAAEEGRLVFLGGWCRYLPQWNWLTNILPPLGFMMIQVLDLVFGVQFAQKLALLCAWFFLAGVVSWFLWKDDKKIAAVVSFGLLLFVQAGVVYFGFDALFLFGGIHWYLGWTLFMLVMWMFSEKDSLHSWMLKSIVGGLLLLAHPIIFMYAVIGLVILVVAQEIPWKYALVWISLAGLLGGFYVIPFVVRMALLIAKGAWGALGQSSIEGTLMILGRVGQVGASPHPLFIGLGVIGLVYVLRSHSDRTQTFIKRCLAVIVVLLIASLISPLRTILQVERLVPLEIIVLVIGISTLFESRLRLARRSVRDGLIACCVTGIVMWLMISMMQMASMSAGLVYTSGDDRIGIAPATVYRDIAQVISGTSGGLLVEETHDQRRVLYKMSPGDGVLRLTRFWTPVSLAAHVKTFTVATEVIDQNKSIIFLEIVGPQHIFRDHIDLDQREDLIDALDDLGVQYVLTADASSQNLYTILDEVNSFGNFTLYRNPHVQEIVSVLWGQGSITSSTWSGLNIVADVDAIRDVTLLIKEVYWPNWHAYVDGEEVVLEREDSGFMSVYIPKGSHQVVLNFELEWWEVFGRIVSAIGVLIWLCACCMQGKNRRF